MAVVSGWVTIAFIFVAACLPLGHWLYKGRRASPQSQLTSIHVTIGAIVALTAFVHSLLAVLSLGTSQAIGAGDLGLALGGAGVFVLMAHIGIGLSLRKPKVRNRPAIRARHRLTALTIAVLAIAHTAIIWANR